MSYSYFISDSPVGAKFSLPQSGHANPSPPPCSTVSVTVLSSGGVRMCFSWPGCPLHVFRFLGSLKGMPQTADCFLVPQDTVFQLYIFSGNFLKIAPDIARKFHVLPPRLLRIKFIHKFLKLLQQGFLFQLHPGQFIIQHLNFFALFGKLFFIRMAKLL